MLILHAPLEIGVAVVFGFLWGVLITYLPAQPRPSPFIRKVFTTHYSISTSRAMTVFRLVLLLLGALLAMFGSDVIHLKGSSTLRYLQLEIDWLKDI